MSKCHYCHGKGVLPGFDDSPGDSRFIFCSMCNATGVAQYADPTETFYEPVCHCGLPMAEHTPWGSCTSPIEMEREW